jgi:RpiB/LacA/LacB family sugar-phosphate isomerase
MIYLTSDHGGFLLKREISNYLHEKHLDFIDLGPDEYDPDDDYTAFTLRMIEKMRTEDGVKGIILCRNGVGVSMLANKFKGIRAALSFSSKHAASSRNDDDSNVLAIPADFVTKTIAIETVEAWLDTPFSGAERHTRRIRKGNLYGQDQL